METITIYITDLKAFYESILDPLSGVFDVLSLRYDKNNNAFVTFRCKLNEIFWIGYLYRIHHVNNIS